MRLAPRDKKDRRRPPRVFIVEGNETVRLGLEQKLQDEGFEVCGSCATAIGGIERILGLHPDVSLLELELSDGTAVDICRAVHRADPGIACVILASLYDKTLYEAASLAGASAWVLKELRGNALVTALRQAARHAS